MSEKNVQQIRHDLREVSEEELQRELKRRQAVELKEQYDKQVVIGKFIQEHRTIFLTLANLLGDKRLIEMLSNENNFWGQAMSVDFSLYEDDPLYDKCFPHSAGNRPIWEGLVE